MIRSGVMCQRLDLAGSDLSPDAALADLRRIQQHTVSNDNDAPIHGVSTVQSRQAQAYCVTRVALRLFCRSRGIARDGRSAYS